MTGYIIDCHEQVWRLPVLLSWDISHGLGEPCDAFEVSFEYTNDMMNMLYGAVRFRSEHEGKTVFCGVVDEHEITVDEGGRTATVRGRSLAALLLDNQCEAAQYYGAGLDYILRRHVYPLGITDVRKKSMKSAPEFSVSSGESQWGVLREFCWFAGGVMPRFSREGTLLLNGQDGERLTIDGKSAVTSAVLRDDRYGVISQVLVKNKSRKTEQTVTNGKYASRGVKCGRVISVPRKTSYDVMRYTGQYQIACSQRGKRVVELTLTQLFAAFAGDMVELVYWPLGLRGNYRVYASRCWADKNSAGTVLTLEEV